MVLLAVEVICIALSFSVRVDISAPPPSVLSGI
jgi:hypothetical protein